MMAIHGAMSKRRRVPNVNYQVRYTVPVAKVNTVHPLLVLLVLSCCCAVARPEI